MLIIISLATEAPAKPTPVWQQVAAAIPIAALTTVVLGFLIAGALARRQENGKRRLAAEDAVRTVVREMRSEVLHTLVATQFASTNNVAAPELTTGRSDDFADDVVNAATGLSKRRQKKVRAVLVELSGEARVRMSEEIGPTNAGLRKTAPGLAAAGRAGWLAQEVMPTGVAFRNGSLFGFITAPSTAGKDEVAGQLDALARLVSGKVGLHGRKSLEWYAKRVK